MSSASKINEQLEMMKALIELRVIKREGSDLVFRLGEVYDAIEQIRHGLITGNKQQREIAHKFDIVSLKFSNALYNLQNLIDIGEL